ncbi:hypothetical protein KSX_41370 [Ktedonospora formicarum]|uniref:DUF1080 domain-containing protein n=1 Tax=Ktedonospora formicarum TaxID=2778364 RepID=A0A8J3HYA8_9CHLR|nr:hypothetical protein KSX_41370 [Ktedonospora formicarum]
MLTYLFMPRGQVTQASSSDTSQKSLNYASDDPQIIYTSVTSKTPTRVDPLNDISTSYWGNTPSCSFKNGSFHVVETKARYFDSCTSEMIYSNFAFQVEVNILQGNAGGMTFRGSGRTHTYYVWRVDTTGAYRLIVYNKSGTSPVLLEGAHIPYFKSRYNQKNQLTVIAYNSDILLYVNQHNIGRVKDTSYTSGYIGLLSYNSSDTTEISFTNAKTWILS